ncbi:MAG: polysaccharide biosynthesis protein [Acidobacteriaceae bacterium]
MPVDPIPIPGVAGQCVLVTGAGGFIGSEMVRVLAASGAEKIILLETAEQHLFVISSEMTARGYGDRCVPILGSVCDRALLAALFGEHRPEIILHAAALKHVPLMEHNPFAAIGTNSLGTWWLAKVAAEYRTRRLILVSTDKAVAPHSIMGASKRIAELIALANPQFAIAVRLVNVIGSPGSVSPLFADQIACGGPITVTHPGARRFFLTLHEVIHLLAQAIDVSQSGILVPNGGDSIRIEDLARRMIAASGCDIRIVFTGTRPGDKLEESLVSEGERDSGFVTTGLRLVTSPPSLNLDDRIRALESAIAARDLPLLLSLVQGLVPDYEPSLVLRNAAPERAAVPALTASR